MRVLHISEAFGGGLRTAIINYINATPDVDYTLYARVREAHETVAVPASTEFIAYTGGLAGFFRGALKTAADGQFDIVHLHASFAGVLRAFLPRDTTIVYSPHCYAIEERPVIKTVPYWVAEGALAQRTQLLMAVSPYEIALGRRLNKRMPARLVTNAPAPAASAPGKLDDADRPDGLPIIAMLGRICPQKGPKYFAKVARAGQGRYRYMWIGEGDQGKDELEAAGVEITGWMPATEARELLGVAALYVHTAAWEGGPLAPLEAADAGCPLLCRDIPSMRSLDYPLAGTTPAATAAAIDQFFNDADYREKIRAASAALVTTYTRERMADELASAYSFAVASLSPARRGH